MYIFKNKRDSNRGTRISNCHTVLYRNTYSIYHTSTKPTGNKINFQLDSFTPFRQKSNDQPVDICSKNPRRAKRNKNFLLRFFSKH